GELLTDDCSFTLMPIGHTWRGRNNVMSAVMAAGSRRTHDSRSKVNITNWFTNNEYLLVEYEHAAIVGGVRVKIDGYCWVFHIRDGRFGSMREYINPSNAGHEHPVESCLESVSAPRANESQGRSGVLTGRRRFVDPSALSGMDQAVSAGAVGGSSAVGVVSAARERLSTSSPR
uniref:nuclear transport factor 2 family protein n=1 Tax=Mycobacterium sp. TaxID=1785 RepID=UPI003F9B8CF9